MKNDLDDLLNQVFGKRGLRPAGAGGAPQKKDGAPLPELHADPVVSGERVGAQKASRPAPAGARKAPAPKKAAAPAAKVPEGPAAQAPDSAPSPSAADAIRSIQQNVLAMNDALDARIASQREEIAKLNENALEDIKRIGEELNTPQVKALARPDDDGPLPEMPRAGAEGFAGLDGALCQDVLGQEAYCRALAIALKRPYVMGHEGEKARGAFLVTGPEDTGRHRSLQSAAAFLAQANVFSSPEVQWVDLGLYPSPAEEKLFLQDLYRAFAAPGDMVVFENYERCHAGFLAAVSDLVREGSHALPGRYVEQNGRLIDATGALVKDAVSALTPRGKYLVLLTDKSPAKLADRFGGPFLSALSDVCETKPFTSEARRALAEKEFTALAARAKGQLGFALAADEAALALLAAQGGKAERGCTALLRALANVYEGLAQYKLTHDAQSTGASPLPCALSAQEDAFTLAVDGGAPIALAALLPEGYHGDAEAVREELADIVGLDEIKQYILSLEENYAVQKRRKAAGLQTASVSMHMIFTGNPGTGKTTIARLVGKYLKAIGVLSGGQLVEVTRADLVGRYVGHTAPQTTAVIRSALGGVLFIDEAYSLYRGKDDSFGLEAIDTLVKGMEDHRDDLLVILAGYTKEMGEFLTANSGLKSRFPNVIEFPDYTGAELLAIARIQAKSKGYVLDQRCDAPLLTYFNAVQVARARDAGNGRLARNKIEEAILAQSRRVAKDEQADLSTLLPEDLDLTDVNG